MPLTLAMLCVYPYEAKPSIPEPSCCSWDFPFKSSRVPGPASELTIVLLTGHILC